MNKRTRQKVALAYRFWSKVNVKSPNQCWPWTAGTNNKGYGTFGLSKYVSTTAHRVAYELDTGEKIPAGFDAAHKCDNPICCNPHHIEIKTRKENMQDAVSRRRMMFGENHYRARLTEVDVREIRRLISEGVRQNLLAKMFKVSTSHVHRIKEGSRWAHIA